MPLGNVDVGSDLWEYMQRVSSREPDILRRLREETQTHPKASMQISPDQGQFMGFLMHLTGAHKTLEVGVFTGYSALAVALALPDDGRIIACDINEEWTSIARRYWREAEVQHKIDLRLAPALKTLDSLIAMGQGGSFDFAFIDADKENYDHYYERALVLLRPGGLIAIDNVLWSGRVIDPNVNDPDTVAIRALNEKLRTDDRVWLSMLAVHDGLTLACKKRA
jgi:predicted O-methyltransferase YrrM